MASNLDRRRLKQKAQSSSALVITLLAVTLLTIVVIAFMQTMTLALSSSVAYANIERATLASDAGLEAAVAQLRAATGPNLAFVTGQLNQTNAGAIYPMTVIGQRDLTNMDQVMPLVSGPITNLSYYDTPGFYTNYALPYLTPRLSTTAGVDVNNVNSTNLNFIAVTNDPSQYRATWVVLTNMVGNPPRPSYTRYAYVVTDEAARINPLLANGAGTGYSSPTNWYTGPQDISITNASAPLLSSDQMKQLTNNAASFGYSEATLGQVFTTRADYEAVKNEFTTETNATVDMIPAWMPDGTNGLPKYNLNDLATNTAYGSTPTLRAQHIGAIISTNLPNFYMRDPALSGTNTTLYDQRLGADIVDYIEPANTFTGSGTGEYTTNTTGIAPPGTGLYPVYISERDWANPGGITASSAQIYQQYWVSVWNPFTKPITITNALLHVSNLPNFAFGGTSKAPSTYRSSVYFIGGQGNGIVRPNEYVTLGFQTNTEPVISGTCTTTPPQATMGGQGAGTPLNLSQYALYINGQVVAQTQGGTGSTPGGGLEHQGTTIWGGSNSYVCDHYQENGNPVADPRFQNYQSTVWTSITAGNGYGDEWNGSPDAKQGGTHSYDPAIMWTNGDNCLANTTVGGNILALHPDAATASPLNYTPDIITSTYKTSDAVNAPYYISNTNMTSIGELGHIYDPAHVNNFLTTDNYRFASAGVWTDGQGSGQDSGYYVNPFQVGGARSLRIGAPEYTPTGAPQTGPWDTTGVRAISLLDLFTVNSTNLTTMDSTNVTTMAMGGRINPNTASSNVLASVFAGIQVNSDTNSSGGNSFTIGNPGAMAAGIIKYRPYSSFSDFNKCMRTVFYTSANYTPNWAVMGNNPYDYNYVNRVRQEAFGKWIQHVTLQSHHYRVYVIGQVLDASLNPKSSVVMEAGVALNYQASTTPSQGSATPAQYLPSVEYIHFLQ